MVKIQADVVNMGKRIKSEKKGGGGGGGEWNQRSLKNIHPCYYKAPHKAQVITELTTFSKMLDSLRITF